MAGDTRVRLLAGMLVAALAFVACTVERTPTGLGPPFLRVARVTRVSDVAASSPPAWDARGTVLAFGTDDGIWRVRADGTDSRQVASLPNVTEVAWEPDGRALAAVSSGSLYIVGLDALPPTAVPAADGVRLVTWAPRQPRLAYVVSRGGRDEVATWQAGRGGERPPVALAAGLTVQTLAWSRDGRALLLALAPQGQEGSDRLLRLDVAPRRPVLVPFAWRDAMAEPTFDPLGRFVAYISDRTDTITGKEARLTVVRLDGTGRRALTDLGVYTGLSWAPSGTVVAFGVVGDADDMSVEVVDVTTGARLRVADYRPEIIEYARTLVTRWAPDGLRLAFGTDAAGGRGPVWVATLERR